MLFPRARRDWMGGVGWVSVECAPASAAGSSETSPKLYGLAVISGTVGRAIQKGGVPPFLQPLHVANYIRFLQISSDPFIQPHVSLSLEGNGVDDTMGSPVSLYEWGVGKGSWRRWESAFSLMLLGFPPQIHIPPASSRTVSPRGSTCLLAHPIIPGHFLCSGASWCPVTLGWDACFV